MSMKRTYIFARRAVVGLCGLVLSMCIIVDFADGRAGLEPITLAAKQLASRLPWASADEIRIAELSEWIAVYEAIADKAARDGRVDDEQFAISALLAMKRQRLMLEIDAEERAMVIHANRERATTDRAYRGLK